MQIEKLTEKARQIIASSNEIAEKLDHQRLIPEHLLASFLDDKDAHIRSYLESITEKITILTEKNNKALAKVPKVKGISDILVDNIIIAIISAAERLAKELNDSYVSSEVLFLALLEVKSNVSDLLNLSLIHI